MKHTLCFLLALSSVSLLRAGYLVTTPRRWTSGQAKQVCVVLSSGASSDDSIKVEITEKDKILLKSTYLSLPEGETNICNQIILPDTRIRLATLTISGIIHGSTFNESKPIKIDVDVARTFVQTDKYIYKPGQLVQFRLLTLVGPYLRISMEQYDEIWIENPSGTRIRQWLDVPNENGLIHLSFTLSDEPEKGKYKICVQSQAKKIEQYFKVEEYVLPRYEVVIKPPSYILATAETMIFRVCAKYTFGQPVNGEVSLEIQNDPRWWRERLVVKKERTISGCQKFKFNSTDLSQLSLNGKYFASSLTAKAEVIEKGTGIKMLAKPVTVDISRKVLNFKDVGLQKFYKPELPYIAEIKVTYPDGKRATDEPLEVCARESCQTFLTNGKGILKFAVPPHIQDTLTIKSQNHHRVSSSSHYEIMRTSTHTKYVEVYYSPSNSSLVTAVSNDELKCLHDEDKISLELPVLFAAVNESSADVSVQVISRGQIQFSKTFKQELIPMESLDMDESILLEPMKKSATKNLIRGSFVLSISLPKTISPEAWIVIWYTRSNGEVVADFRSLDVTECLLNDVSLSWSSDLVLPGAVSTISLEAEPSSLCSLGVVDKSVQLLSSEQKSLTIKSLLSVAKKYSVPTHENSQVDNTKFCSESLDSNITPPDNLIRIERSYENLDLAHHPKGLHGRKRRSFPPHHSMMYVTDKFDSLTMFNEAGVYVFSDLTLETRPCLPNIIPFNVYDDDIVYYFSPMEAEESTIMTSKILPKEESVRSYFPETWIWELFPVGYVYARTPFSGRDLNMARRFDTSVNSYVQVARRHQGSLNAVDNKSRQPKLSKVQSRTYFPETWLWYLNTIPPPGPPGMEFDGPAIPLLPIPLHAPGRHRGSMGHTTNNSRKPKPLKEQKRTYFPETWLWHLHTIPEDGVWNENLTLPHTVTEWVGSAVCVHPTKGIGLSLPSSITTFRDFFLDLTLPPSAKRGEIFPVKISIFNYLKESLPVKVILKESPDYDILGDEGEDPMSGERSACLPPLEKIVHSIRIRPKEVGKINLTASASIDINSINACPYSKEEVQRDTVIKPILVEIEGEPKEKTWSKYICPNDADLESSEDVFERWIIETPPSIVPDSARGFVSAVGDLLGPTIENLGGLVKLPYGCGEQNMLNFAPNIFVMQYLDSSGQNNPEIVERATEFMIKGYQRELTYRHRDGSYSAFGENDPSGSTWLTAFVLKSFAQARNYIDIDTQDLNISIDWLKQQQLENGCFNLVGKILHQGMKGGLSENESPVLLSSFVLIALIEAGEGDVSSAVRESLFCLHADEESPTPYTLAVKAYALALAKSPNAREVLDTLLSKAKVKGTTLYWELPSKDSASSQGVAVETAGYAILAILAQAEKSESDLPTAKQILQWMNSERNGQGGFVSTQDTIVALQALAEFEKLTSQDPLDAHVIVQMDDSDDVFVLDESNKLLQQKTKLSSIPTTVNIHVAGTGCVLMQAVLRYNVPEAEPSEAFELTVNSTTERDDSCKTKRISVCASYLLGKDGTLVSNMAIIEVNLVSGYIPKKADLKQLVSYGTGLFKTYEVDGSRVTIYVDEFSKEQICASFRIIREVDVENPKPGFVKVYDYYKPEYFVTMKYELPPTTECVSEDELLSFEKEVLPNFHPEMEQEENPNQNLEDMLNEFEEALP